MKYLAQEAVIPIRAEAKESAEMLTQLLFGERCTVLDDQQPNWWRVKLEDDGYEGWLNPRMLVPIGPEDEFYFQNMYFVHTGSVDLQDGSSMALPMGARVPHLNEQPFQVGGQIWTSASELMVFAVQSPDSLLGLAQLFINVPYLWGGRSGFGIDCSGLSQMIYRMVGIELPRDSSKQGLEGKAVEFDTQQSGDLAFFRKADRQTISHVGVLDGEGHIIHASGKVRKDPFTSEGIQLKETGEITHWLVSIRRYL